MACCGAHFKVCTFFGKLGMSSSNFQMTVCFKDPNMAKRLFLRLSGIVALLHIEPMLKYTTPFVDLSMISCKSCNQYIEFHLCLVGLCMKILAGNFIK